MSNPAEDGDALRKLAGQYLQLWVEHWGSCLAAPETAEATGQIFAQLRGLTAGIDGAGSATGARDDSSSFRTAHDAGDGRGGKFESRIAALERRLAELEARTQPDVARIPESLAAALAQADPQALGSALDREIVDVWGRLADGIAAYRAHPYRRGPDKAEPVWGRASAILYDHATREGGTPALFVPSLINRGYILDLKPGRGMLSWLAGQGVHPYRLEWGAPGAEERTFDIADYVAHRLEPALDEVARRAGAPPVLVGYCMGGLLALLAALKRPEMVRGLALLATPWDFHAEAARATAMAAVYRAGRPLMGLWGEVPVDAIQSLFAMHDPILALRKFQHFATLGPGSAEAEAFVALEDWLNDGMALSLPVADDAVIGWYGDNTPGRGAWRPGRVHVQPAALDMPTLVVVPATDRIVPPASAAAILPHLPRAVRMDPPLGHIGMVVGRRAQASLWRPLAQWIAGIT